MELIFIIHLFTSLLMTGLCWFVQIVHYPLFHQIKLEEFSNYERKNVVTGFITVPLMTIELATGLYLLWANPSFIYLLNVGLLGLIGLSTVFYQVPIHLKLIKDPSIALINKLILTNWIRTISWAIRLILLALLLSQSIVIIK